MSDALIQLSMFTAKTFIILLVILLCLFTFIMLIALVTKSKNKNKGRLQIKHLNKKYEEAKDLVLNEILSKKSLKKLLKEKKTAKKTAEEKTKKIFVINFNGDIKASGVCGLNEEINTILSVANSTDEVVLRLESPGGVVHGYGLAAAQLMRLRAHQIPLTVAIDKVAASGGYLMACIANHIMAAPFAIVGSIGVIVQLPNFHRVLKDKHIDFEQHTAGEFKRTISLFGEITPEGREKLQEEIEDIHQQFKNTIIEHRPKVNIDQVATGEHWSGQQAMQLKLVDEIRTSDDYLLEKSKVADIYELTFEMKKPFLSKFSLASLSAFLLKQLN